MVEREGDALNVSRVYICVCMDLGPQSNFPFAIVLVFLSKSKKNPKELGGWGVFSLYFLKANEKRCGGIVHMENKKER